MLRGKLVSEVDFSSNLIYKGQMERINFKPERNLNTIQTMFRTMGHEIRIVGGAVRDILLGEEPKDIDLCTTATPDQMIEVAEAFPWECHVVPTGLQHGTVTFVFEDGGAYEITTLRIDTDTDGRHAEVEFTTDFQRDAARRDLTINAMSMDLDGTIYDYFNGREDLRVNRVRFVGNTEQRIREDYLRILRYFRFAARFSSLMHYEDLETIEHWASGLQDISRERIWQEMSKLLMAPSRRNVMRVMEKYHVLDHIGLDVRYEHGHSLLDNADCCITAIACYLTQDPEAFARGWKMSVPEINKLCWMTGRKLEVPFLYDIEDLLVAGKPRDWVVSWTKLHGDNRAVFHAESWEIPEFPVRGQDLLNAGMSPGKEVGIALASLKRAWIASRFTLTRDELLCPAEVTTPKPIA